MTAHGLVVIGCGEFGAAAVSHLRERGAEAASVGGRRAVALVTLTGKVTTRQQAEGVFAAATGAATATSAGRWRELEDAFGRVGASPLIALIGAADDAAGGGLLVAALRYLAEGRHGRTRAVWLALPTSGSRTQARAYATLLELEVLRGTAALSRCFLREVQGDPLELAGMFGEAAVAYAQGHPGVGMYAGFGLGAVRDVAAVLVEQAAVLAARALVEQRGSARVYQRAGFGEALMRVADDLVRPAAPEAWYAERWMPESESHFVPHCLNEDYVGERLADFLERHLKDQYHYYNADSSQWIPGVRRRCQALKQTVLNQIRALRETCGSESQAACAELSDALARLDEALRRAGAVHEQSYRRLLQECEPVRLQIRDHVAWLQGGTFSRKPTVEQRQKVVQAFEHIDRKVAVALIDRVRFQELQTALIDLEKEQKAVAAALAAAGKREDALGKLRDEVMRWDEATVPGRQAVHLYPAMPGVEAARRLADAVEPATLIAALNHARVASGQAAALRHAAEVGARAALERMPELLPPRGDTARERWLSVVKPGLAVARTCRVGQDVAAELRAELAQQLGVTPVPAAGKWFQGDGLVYCETDGVELAALQVLPGLQEAYSAQAGQQPGLHVLPAPVDGWPELLPVTRLSRQHLEAAATTVVRSCLLGLIGPAFAGGVAARYVPADGAAIHSVLWANLGEAVRRLAEQQTLQDGLGAQADRWLGRLDAEQLAGYYALLTHFRQSAVVTQLSGDLAAVLTSAIDAELEGASSEPRARAMAAQVGSVADAFSLPAGEWRYLKW